MQTVPHQEFSALILSAYTTKNRAPFLDRDSVHLAIDYRRLLLETGRRLSRRDTERLTDALCRLLAQTEKIPVASIQRRKMRGEIRLHAMLYHWFRIPGCDKIDLNIFPDGRVQDKRWLVNFLSTTLFRVL